MSSVKKSIMIMALCTLFSSLGQIFFKMASSEFSLDILALISNYHLIIGAISYLVGAVLMIIALKTGDLSIVYPMISISFIWVAILSTICIDGLICMGEVMTRDKILGMFFIFSGITSLGIGSRKRGKH